MNCPQCGASIADGATFCPSCGTAVAAPQPQNPYAQPATPVYAEPAAAPVVDKGSVGWAILGFLIPLVGIILFFVWRNKKPDSAKKAIIGAAIGLVFNIIVQAAGLV